MGVGSNITAIIFNCLFYLIFIGVFVVMIVTLVRSLGRWHKNNQSPRLTVDAAVVAKRMDRVHHRSSHVSSTGHTTTTYYATFQVESGDRMELVVPGTEYGMLVEGDHGKLTFQGTRYLGFQRGNMEE